MAENNVPVWVAALAAVGAGGVSAMITTFAKFQRTPAEADAKSAQEAAKEASMLTITLRENRELREEFGKIWTKFEGVCEELSMCQQHHRECEDHHRECLRVQKENADRAERLEEKLGKLAGKVEDIQEQQKAA